MQVRHDARLVIIEAIQVQVAVLGVSFYQTLPLRKPGRSVAEAVKQCFKFVFRGRRDLPETQFPTLAKPPYLNYLTFRGLRLDRVDFPGFSLERSRKFVR